MYKFASCILVLAAAVVVTSCGRGDNPNVSPTTGWEYNNPDNGGFEVVTGAEQTTGPGLVLIEGGTFTMGRIQEDVLYDWNNAVRRVTVSSFYMDGSRVRNIDYRMYLWWLKRVYVELSRSSS
ncbi:MAG: SUMF1/EgtB/PvdO family nonheme iron enzyme [Bacteroidales bacterium]